MVSSNLTKIDCSDNSVLSVLEERVPDRMRQKRIIARVLMFIDKCRKLRSKEDNDLQTCQPWKVQNLDTPPFFGKKPWDLPKNLESFWKREVIILKPINKAIFTWHDVPSPFCLWLWRQLYHRERSNDFSLNLGVLIWAMNVIFTENRVGGSQLILECMPLRRAERQRKHFYKTKWPFNQMFIYREILISNRETVRINYKPWVSRQNRQNSRQVWIYPYLTFSGQKQGLLKWYEQDLF